VAKKATKRLNVSAMLHPVDRERMPELMWRNEIRVPDSGHLSHAFHYALNPPRPNRKNPTAIAIPKIRLQKLCSFRLKEHDSVLAAFPAPNKDQAFLKVDLLHLETGKLANSKPSGHHQTNHEPVPVVQGLRLIEPDGKNLVHIILLQIYRKRHKPLSLQSPNSL
jgi:hypothetical protein